MAGATGQRRIDRRTRIRFHSLATNWTFGPCFERVIYDRMRGRSTREIARAFQRGIAHGLYTCRQNGLRGTWIRTVVLSGGVFQNELLLEDLKPLLEKERLQVWTNHAVPPNDGGISLGQAALAAFEHEMPPTERPMHELSIAMSIVDMAQEEAERRDVTIDAVYLELGPLSGVVADALLFSYEMACSGTALEGSRLVIKEVPIEVYCPVMQGAKNLAFDAMVLLSGVRHTHLGRDSRKRTG